ncbi:MAG: hypothetical protein QOH04_661, partial [Sphingomonadales bacterium]|nr:hypothetical protein [Sphingomonadales bacterium]
PVTRAEVKAKVDARFARLDANRDGYISADEIRSRGPEMRRDRAEGPDMRGPRPEGAMMDRSDGGRRAEMFARLDANHDGVVTRDEFLRAAPPSRPRGEGFAPRPLEGRGEGPGPRFGGRGGHGGFGGRGIERMDANRDGRVSLAEAEARALQAFDRADANHDGVVTPEERQAARGAMRERFQDRRGG